MSSVGNAIILSRQVLEPLEDEKCGEFNTALSVLGHDMEQFQVCAPLIGRFSSGKTATVNSLLEFNTPLLQENIDPTTAYPMEIMYGQDSAMICWKDDLREEQMDIPTFLDGCANGRFDAEKVSYGQLTLKTDFLAQIPSLKLVDMPGFESGIEAHNRAIDSYLEKSIVYLLVFSAEDASLTTSMREILRELHREDIPVRIIITKKDQVTETVLEETLVYLREQLKKDFPRIDTNFAVISNRDGEIEAVKEMLERIQANSDHLREKRFAKRLSHETQIISSYLRERLGGCELTQSELLEKQDTLRRQSANLQKESEAEMTAFEQWIPECAAGIRGDLGQALEAQAGTMARMMADGCSQTRIAEKINMVAREAVSASYQKRYIPKLQKYLEKMGETLQVDASCLVAAAGRGQCGEELGTGIHLAAIVGGLLLGGPIGALLAHIFASVYNKAQERKRNEYIQNCKQELRTGVFPQVVNETASRVEMQLREQSMNLRKQLTEEYERQQQALQGALEENLRECEIETQARERKKELLTYALNKMEEIRNGLQA